MNKKVLYLLFLLQIISINALDFGIGGELMFLNTTQEVDEFEAKVSEFEIKPFLRIELSEKSYIEPFFYYKTHTEEDADSMIYDIENDYTYSSIGGGFDFGKVAYRNDLITLNYSAGTTFIYNIKPEGDSVIEYDNYNNIALHLTGDVSADISLTEHLKLRISNTILSCNIVNNEITIFGNDYSTSAIFFDTGKSWFEPSLSFYYMF